MNSKFLAVVAMLLALGSASIPARELTVLDALPQDTRVVLALRDGERTLELLRQTSLAKLLQTEDLKDFAEPVRRRMAQELTELTRVADLDPLQLPSLVRGSFACGQIRGEKDGKDTWPLLCAYLAPTQECAKAAWNAFLAMHSANGRREVAVGGHAAVELQRYGEVSRVAALEGRWVLWSDGNEGLQVLLDTVAERQKRLAWDPVFARAQAHILKRHGLFFFLRFNDRKAGEKNEEDKNEVLKKLGLYNLKGYAWNLAVDGPGFRRSAVWITSRMDEGLPEIFPAQAPDETALRILPRETESFTLVRVHPGRLLSFLSGVIAAASGDPLRLKKIFREGKAAEDKPAAPLPIHEQALDLIEDLGEIDSNLEGTLVFADSASTDLLGLGGLSLVVRFEPGFGSPTMRRIREIVAQHSKGIEQQIEKVGELLEKKEAAATKPEGEAQPKEKGDKNDKVGKEEETSWFSVRRTVFQNVEIEYLSLRLTTFAPAVFQTGDYLVVAGSVGQARRMIRTLNGDPSLLDDAAVMREVRNAKSLSALRFSYIRPASIAGQDPAGALAVALAVSPWFANLLKSSPLDADNEKLKSLGKVCREFAKANQDQFPAALDTLVAKGENAALLRSPLGVTYDYVSGMAIGDPDDAILAFGPVHEGERNVLTVDGKVKRASIGDNDMEVGGETLGREGDDVVLSVVKKQGDLDIFKGAGRRLGLQRGQRFAELKDIMPQPPAFEAERLVAPLGEMDMALWPDPGVLKSHLFQTTSWSRRVSDGFVSETYGPLPVDLSKLGTRALATSAAVGYAGFMGTTYLVAKMFGNVFGEVLEGVKKGEEKIKEKANQPEF